MIIEGRLGDYNVKWGCRGWTWAVPIVHVRKQFLFFSFWKKTWEGPAKPALEVKRMHPTELRAWFQSAVDEYENYIEAWQQDRNTTKS